MYESRIVWIGFYLISQCGNESVNRPRSNNAVVSPCLVQDLIAGQGTAAASEKEFQQLGSYGPGSIRGEVPCSRQGEYV